MTKGILNYIMTRGVTKSKGNSDDLTVYLNMVCFLSCIGVLFISSANFYFYKDYIYLGICFHIFLTFFGVIVLHHFSKLKAAKVFFSIGISFWILLATILIGGFFSQSLVVGTSIAVTFLLFKQQAKFGGYLILINSLSFVAANIYSYFNKPLFGIRDYPGDELGFFFLCLAWLSIIFYTYESRKVKLIKSLKNSNKELIAKTDELQKFTYVASHDLKSPLVNMINFLNLMKEDLEKKNYENLKSYLHFSQAGAHQMNELIEAVLELSKINEGKKDQYKVNQLNAVLNKAIKNSQKEIRAKGGFIQKGELPELICNEIDLLVIFQNLIKNAFHYNKSSKPVLVISSEVNENQIFITFRDNGIGIKEKYHAQIFEYFKRLHNNAEFSGTGIGLGLCRKIMDRYEGTISVKSEFGVYTEFTLMFPRVENLAERSDETIYKRMRSN